MDNLIWLDLEMTGLDVSKERIIEVACIITDKHFVELETYHTAVKQSQDLLEKMDSWNKETHGATGLLDRIPNGKEETLVESDLVDLVTAHFPKAKGPIKERPMLAGNSIHQDKLFIDKYFPKVSDCLNYRMLDVTSLKIIFEGFNKPTFEKKNTHKALDDIRESIAEFKFYLNEMKL